MMNPIKLTIDDRELAEKPEVKKWLEEAADKVWDQYQKELYDLVVYGKSGTFFNGDEFTPIRMNETYGRSPFADALEGVKELNKKC